MKKCMYIDYSDSKGGGGGDDEDEFDRMARERDEDLKERDAFAQRMLEKDKAKQDKRKGIVSKSDKKGFEEVGLVSANVSGLNFLSMKTTIFNFLFHPGCPTAPTRETWPRGHAWRDS